MERKNKSTILNPKYSAPEKKFQSMRSDSRLCCLSKFLTTYCTDEEQEHQAELQGTQHYQLSEYFDVEPAGTEIFEGFEVTQKAADKRLIVMLKVILCEFNQIE